MMYGPRREPDGLVERFNETFLAWLACLIFGLLIAFIVAVLFLFAAQPSLASDERQVRRDCRMDALKHCKTSIVSLDRNTIIACMVANRDKLSAACAKHLWVNP